MSRMQEIETAVDEYNLAPGRAYSRGYLFDVFNGFDLFLGVAKHNL